jgi:site-specific DNA recombinase
MPPTTTTRTPTDTTAAETSALTKRAFAYLRVSSDGQVNTDYSRDGLSIMAQREAAKDKATQLAAEIVREFSDPGRSAFVDLHKRIGFLEMLDELKRCNEHESTRVDYVIVWALNRWARNTQDNFRTHDLVRATGARLISITEPMIGENTPESFWMEGMLAVNNQYESMRTGRAVKGGLYTKARLGGTYGWAPIGYVNDVDPLPDGRKIASVTLDPKRHPFVTTAFQLYASGEYSLSQLADELHELGLRTRRTRRHPDGRQISISTLQRLLRDPYYVGLIVYKRGTKDEEVFDGRHDALIDQDTFDIVQTRLDEKRVAGERPQKRQHYLRGSVFCGECGRRLTFGISTGKAGRRYPYFFCSARIGHAVCTQRVNVRPELIEQAIQRYYVERPVQLTAQDVQERTEAIEALVSVSQQAVIQVKQAKTGLIAKLKAQQTRLIRLHAEEGDDISPDAFREERARLQSEITSAEKSLAETEQRLQIDADALRMALELAEDVAQVYQTANEQTKRGYNQAFFTGLHVMPEWDEAQGQIVVKVIGAELTEPYALLLAEDLAAKTMNEVKTIRATDTNTESGPVEPPSAVTKPLSTAVSIFDQMAGATGVKPSIVASQIEIRL